ncbi:receptor-like kinase TMK3 [Henckelia pumila]|uniref:receptor-like kinase TMK3 n=1 Tax=Henckelia pumila TaxID=405737 RepID=UPI003C6E4856
MGTLDRFLFRWKEKDLKPLEWGKQIGIALDVARSVPSNILFGDDMRAKITDFGSIQHVPPHEEDSASANFFGTFGYIAPEYHVPPDEEDSASDKFFGTFGYIELKYVGSDIFFVLYYILVLMDEMSVCLNCVAIDRESRKTDVYCFGVVLMEFITGRKAIDMSLLEEKQYIMAWLRNMKDKDAFITAIDPNFDLNDQETMSCIINVAELAGHCNFGEPKQRPGMER